MSTMSIMEALRRAQEDLSIKEAWVAADWTPSEDRTGERRPPIDLMPEDEQHGRLTMIGQAWDIPNAVTMPTTMGISDGVDFSTWTPARRAA